MTETLAAREQKLKEGMTVREWLLVYFILYFISIFYWFEIYASFSDRRTRLGALPSRNGWHDPQGTEQRDSPEGEAFFFNLKNETIKKSNFQVRERLYEVLSRCIPSNIIFSVFDIFKLPSIYLRDFYFQTLIRELLPACRPEAKVEVIHLAAEYQHRYF